MARLHFVPDSPFVGETPIWQLPTLGGARRIAAYLWFNKQVGDRFTMSELRTALSTGDAPEASEHLNRRLRDLRPQGWIIPSYQDRADLEVDQYELEVKGYRTWLGEGNPANNVSATLRRQVMERDGHRCTLCGVGAGEPYPGLPNSSARMTVGHMRPNARGGKPSMTNLRTECSLCNEPLRDSLRNAETADEVRAALKRLGREDRATLRRWIDIGHLERTEIQVLFDRVRQLSQEDRKAIAEGLR